MGSVTGIEEKIRSLVRMMASPLTPYNRVQRLQEQKQKLEAALKILTKRG